MIYLIIIILLFYLFSLLPIVVNFRVKVVSTNVEVEVMVQLLFLKKTINFHKVKEVQRKQDRFNRFIKKLNLKEHWYFIYVEAKKIVYKLLSKSILKDTSWQTIIGLDDAALTGTLTGIIWSWKTTILGSVSHLVKMTQIPIINVYPQFNSNHFETEFKCIISSKIGHVISAGFYFLYLIFRLYRLSKITTNTSNDFKTLEK